MVRSARKVGGFYGAFLLAISLGASACSEGPRDVFVSEALPVLEARCVGGACHGVGAEEPWPETLGFFVQLDDSGRIADVDQAREAALERVVTQSPPLLSSLLRVPMPGFAGGGPHAGGALFVDTEDPALLALRRWVEAEPDGTGGEDVALDALDALFGQTVLPVLVERCGRGGCHGPTDVAFTAFPGRPDVETGAFAPKDVRAARRVARRHIDLWSADAASSRLVRKAIGSEEGGLVHRGGPATFFPEAPVGRPLDAPGLEAILAWARAERAAVGAVEDQTPSALLYVRGPVAARAPYRIAPTTTGSDLYLDSWPPESGREENLTAALHPGVDAEVRDPALSHDGRRVAFAMRLEGETRFTLWELDLEDRSARRLSPEGTRGSLVQPTYSPDGTVIASWDGHGEAGADGPGVAPELVEIEVGGALRRLTFTPAPEVSPSMLAAGKTRGELVFGTRREGSRGAEGVLFRFPLCHDPGLHGEPEYHVQFGASLAPRAPLSAIDLPEGRQVMVTLDDSSAMDDRGALLLLDRSMGPELGRPVEQASLAGYRPPIVELDAALRFRDPAPLPDGRFLVAADDEASPGRDALYIAAVVDGVAGAELAALEPLLASPGESVRSPVAVFTRPVEDDGHLPVTDPAEELGYLALRDVASLEALYGRTEATGPRIFRSEIRAMRLLISRRTLDADLGRDAGGTRAGLSSRLPADLLAEVPFPEDRSAWLRIPAREPVLIQWLDGEGMVIGRQLDRWYFAEGAESVPGGTNEATYDHSCAGCHGSASGEPEDAVAPTPDILSSASVTLSTHQDRDRRRPLPPTDIALEGRLPIDYRGTLSARLEESCAIAGCHGGAAPAADLPLDDRAGAGRFGAAYSGLTRFIDLEGGRARRSPLVERLLGRELDAPGDVDGPHPSDAVDPELVRDVVRWIEMGAFYDLEAL